MSNLPTISVDVQPLPSTACERGVHHIRGVSHLETSQHFPVSEGITRKMELDSSSGTGVSGHGVMASN